jgi:murein DD-endopeptidase MepM/ murein hydrolase activator NlpD
VSRFLCFVALVAALVLVPPPPPAAGTTYAPPVDAPVVDGFRLPDGPYGAGNRGLEYATSPGDPVHAIADGLVVFAGPVAGSNAVTVLHPDGLRSSYSYLSEVSADVGRHVSRGETVGRAGQTFHLGVRSGGTYLDPAALFTRTSVHLVPVDEPPAGRTKRTAPPSADLVTRAWGWLTGAVTLAGRS